MEDLFASYRADGQAHDEMFEGAQVRPSYEDIRHKFGAMTVEEMRARADFLSTSYLDQGITFAVGGIERPFPLDIMPRLIDPDTWKKVETGVEQRVRALEAFLDDIYDAGELFADGVMPIATIASRSRWLK